MRRKSQDFSQPRSACAQPRDIIEMGVALGGAHRAVNEDVADYGEIGAQVAQERCAAVAQGVEVRFDAGLDPAYPRNRVALDVDSGISSFQQGSCGKKTARQ